jgi:hypothetical protein
VGGGVYAGTQRVEAFSITVEGRVTRRSQYPVIMERNTIEIKRQDE